MTNGPITSYVNSVNSCPHNGDFYWSGEGLYRCKLCGASYEYIRGQEAEEHFKSTPPKTPLVEDVRRFFFSRDRATLVIFLVLFSVAAMRFVLDWLHVTDRKLPDTIVSCVGIVLSVGIILAFVWAKLTRKSHEK